MSDFDRLKIFTGNSNIELAEKIAKKIGIPIGKSVSDFVMRLVRNLRPESSKFDYIKKYIQCW